MIKLNTILSSFDDKATLLKWLKKVEKALADSVLESITAEAVTATTSKLVFHFADKSTIETPAFTVKGDKGDTGATGPQGPQGTTGPTCIYYTEIIDSDTEFENFEFEKTKFSKEVEQGDKFFVIDTNSDLGVFLTVGAVNIDKGTAFTAHFISRVDLKGPQGQQGQQGQQGPAGEDGSDAEVNAENLLNVLEGSETIVVDEAEDGEHVEIHLDSDVVAKIERALLTPIATPATKQIAGVNTSKEQIMFNIGEGLEIVGSTSPFTIRKKKPERINNISSLHIGDLVLIEYVSANFGNSCAIAIVNDISIEDEYATFLTSLPLVNSDDEAVTISRIDTGLTIETNTLTLYDVLDIEISIDGNDRFEFYKL